MTTQGFIDSIAGCNYNTTIDGKRLWSLAMVKKAVVKGWITEAEFKEITGEDYGE